MISFFAPSFLATLTGFHLATKVWGGSVIYGWAFKVCQAPWDIFLEFNSSGLLQRFFVENLLKSKFYGGWGELRDLWGKLPPVPCWMKP